MKRSKKLIGIVLSLILAISITATIFIATANTKETDIIITVDKAELSAGESATVSVKVTSNYPIATMSIPVFYDKTLVDASDVTATLTNYAVKSAIIDAQSKDVSKVYANTGINSDKFGFVLATYIGGAGKEVPETTDNVILTFKITAKTGVSGTETIKCVSQSAKTDENIAGMLYFGATTNGKVIDSIPENIENIDLTLAQANVKIGAEPNTLVIRDEYADSGIIVDLEIAGMMAHEDWYPHLIGAEDAAVTGVIYGLDTIGYDDAFASETYPMLMDALTTNNGDEYLEIIVPETSADGFETTGTIINVLDEDGNAIETYVFVYFGDINGDSIVDTGDGSDAFLFDYTQDSITTVASMIAMDYTGDSVMDAEDGALLFEKDYYGEGYPSQAELAEIFYISVYGK